MSVYWADQRYGQYLNKLDVEKSDSDYEKMCELAFEWARRSNADLGLAMCQLYEKVFFNALETSQEQFDKLHKGKNSAKALGNECSALRLSAEEIALLAVLQEKLDKSNRMPTRKEGSFLTHGSWLDTDLWAMIGAWPDLREPSREESYAYDYGNACDPKLMSSWKVTMDELRKPNDNIRGINIQATRIKASGHALGAYLSNYKATYDSPSDSRDLPKNNDKKVVQRLAVVSLKDVISQLKPQKHYERSQPEKR